MKSLEIINAILEETDCGIVELEDLENIKRDLEVLNILKNYISIEVIAILIKNYDCLTFEELFKLKNCLYENK